jgi:XTP/dITP diphosphohydrolase
VSDRQRVVVATGNAHKLVEIRAVLDLDPDRVQLVGMSDLGVASPVEDGDTFEANALLKARACVAATGLPALADDSGIRVTALGGEPGVRSARFAGEGADDAANNLLLLVRLAAVGAVTSASRRAEFVAAAALVTPDGREHVVVGTMPGYVLDAPRGVHGFGYDPLFVADVTRDGRSNGELTPIEKDAISHRGVAFRALRGPLLELLGITEA